MTRKRLNREAKWGFQFFPYHQMRVETDFFKGLVSVIELTDGQNLYWDFAKAGKGQVAGAGMKWLQFVPDGKKHCVTAKYLPNGKVSVWYVDVIENLEFDEDGMAVIVDKYLDVIFTPQGDMGIDDRDELDVAYESGELSKEQYEEALAEGDWIVANYCKNRWKIWKMERYCNRILKHVMQQVEAGK